MIKKIQLNNTYLLVGGTFCLLIISYQLAFNKTVEAWQLNTKLELQINSATLSEQPAYLGRQDKALANVIKTYKTDTVNYRNNIVTQVSEIGDKEHVRIIEVPTQANLSTAQYLVQKINLKGDFFALLRTLNHLQQIKGVGYIRSVLLKKNVSPVSSRDDKEIVLEVFVEVVK